MTRTAKRPLLMASLICFALALLTLAACVGSANASSDTLTFVGRTFALQTISPYSKNIQYIQRAA